MKISQIDNLIEEAWHVHQQFSDNISGEMSRILKSSAVLECTMIEKIDGASFLKDRKDLLFCVAQMPSLSTDLILAMPKQFSIWIVAKLLNYADPDRESQTARGLTKVEQIGLMPFVNLVFSELSKEWRAISGGAEIQFSGLRSNGSEVSDFFNNMEILASHIEMTIDQQRTENIFFCYQIDHHKPNSDANLDTKSTEDQSDFEKILARYFSQIDKRFDRIEAKLEELSKKKRWRG